MQHVSAHRLASTAGLALLVALAACGSGAGSSSKVATLDSSPAGSATTTTVAIDAQEAMLAYAACMRENGVDMADPTFDADGNRTGGGIGGGAGPDSGIDPRSDEFRAAQEVCGALIEGVSFGGGPGGGLDREATQTALTDFTACLRDEGLDVDDITFGPPGGAGTGDGAPTPDGSLPTPDGSVPGGGFDGGPNGAPPGGGGANGPGGAGFDPTQVMIDRLGLDDTDPAVASALTACQPILDAVVQPTTTEG
ncbi:MAG: hypothetical protein Q7V88_10485 [Actinomycetota bacterium]|nr:hypothetical protein [Actinomycetota bacterium]